MGAEMDCCDSTDDGTRFYVELKTSRELDSHTEERFEREKLLKFWIQSFLAGVPYVVLGFRDDAGRLVRTERLKTKDIGRRVRSKHYWQGKVCLAFADEVLCWLYGTVKDKRYGLQLTSEELQEFDILKDDYEISWHLKHLRSAMSPTSEHLKARSTMVKNRRWASMNKLVSTGQYFSEDAMREREPYLHHEYVGKFQDMNGRGMARPGERWSETLMRRTEEAFLVAKIREEQQRLGVAERDWVGNERTQVEEQEEEEEEEEEEDEEEKVGDEANGHFTQILANRQEATSGSQSAAVAPVEKPTLSAEEMHDQMDQFTHIMQQKFLAGEDHQHLRRKTNTKGVSLMFKL